MATDRYNKNLQAILDQSKLKINDTQLGDLKNLQQYLIDILTEVAAPERAPNEVKEIMMPYVFQCHKLFEKSPELIKVSKNIMLDLETSISHSAAKIGE